MRKGYNMTITEFSGKGGRLLYDVHNDNGGFVARFDSLDDAARVVRYVSGANMGDEERARAVMAMKNSQVARTLNRAKTKKRAAAQGDDEA